jgi:hypothetical protein
MPDRKPVQQLFDFDRPAPVESSPSPVVRAEQVAGSEEPLSALDHLEDWLIDPVTG